ncbi:hypothetical protein ACFL2Q_09230 [Thermodesulfobacteriota bacterium]
MSHWVIVCLSGTLGADLLSNGDTDAFRPHHPQHDQYGAGKLLRISTLDRCPFVLSILALILTFHLLPVAAGKPRPGKTIPSISIQSRIDNGPWRKSRAIYPMKGQEVVLRVKRIPGATVSWYRIIPDLSTMYKNANFPWDKDPYKWAGLAKIKYKKKELPRFKGKWEIRPSHRSTDEEPRGRSWVQHLLMKRKPVESEYLHETVGSFWFQVVVKKDGKTLRSYGIEDRDKRGLSPRVFRVSIRDGNGYLGYLTSFFNVPGLFGSIPYQSYNYIGADCADVLMAAYYRWRGIRMRKDWCVAAIVTKIPKVASFDVARGKPKKKIKWGGTVKPGDLIAVRYSGRKQYQHIGALYKDANRNGLLDGSDIVIHAGPRPLQYEFLREGGFDGHVVVLRLRGLLARSAKPRRGSR